MDLFFRIQTENKRNNLWRKGFLGNPRIHREASQIVCFATKVGNSKWIMDV